MDLHYSYSVMEKLLEPVWIEMAFVQHGIGEQKMILFMWHQRWAC